MIYLMKWHPLKLNICKTIIIIKMIKKEKVKI